MKTRPPSLRYCQDLWEEPPEESEEDPDNQEIPLDEEGDSEV
jgi:hypothetical protein